MPYNDGISRVNSYSITDFHDFNICPLRFFVNHHLGKKYELAEGSKEQVLGTILDETIKLFHSSKAYGVEVDYIPNLVRAAYRSIQEKAINAAKLSFFGSIAPYLNEEILTRAIEVFQVYYMGVGGKIKYSLGPVLFNEWIIKDGSNLYKLWGWPDAYELADDGVAEVVDYKSREDVERGKEYIDMDLMPKMYALLSLKDLKKKGYSKLRFVVRFWQDPKESSYYREFDLEDTFYLESIFKQKIEDIVSVKEVGSCQQNFCRVCKNSRKDEFSKALDELGIKVISEL